MVCGWLFDLQSDEYAGLFGIDGGDAGDGFGGVEPDAVMLDATQVFKSALRNSARRRSDWCRGLTRWREHHG